MACTRMLFDLLRKSTQMLFKNGVGKRASHLGNPFLMPKRTAALSKNTCRYLNGQAMYKVQYPILEIILKLYHPKRVLQHRHLERQVGKDCHGQEILLRSMISRIIMLGIGYTGYWIVTMYMR